MLTYVNLLCEHIGSYKAYYVKHIQRQVQHKARKVILSLSNAMLFFSCWGVMKMVLYKETAISRYQFVDVLICNEDSEYLTCA